MSEKYKFFEGGVFFLTLTVVGWIDVFTRKDYVQIITDSLNFCIDRKGLEVFEFVIMSNHIHLICAARDGHLGPIIRDFKSFTAKEIIRAIQNNPCESRREWLLYMFRYFAIGNGRDREFHFWQHRNHPISLHSQKSIQNRIRYIWNNPVRAGIVEEPQHYIYSSAYKHTPVKIK